MRSDLSERTGSRALEPRQPDELEAVALALEENPETVVPYTGEILDLRDLRAVAQIMAEAREREREIARFRRNLGLVLRLESRRQGTKTLHLDGVTVEITGGSKPGWDVELLREGLEAAGLPPERMKDLIRETVTYSVSARVAKYLEAANPTYAAVVSRARRDEPEPWRVTVKRGREL